MPKNIIHIVLIGEFHRDPAPVWIIREILNKASERNQQVIFCDEESPSSTIDSKLSGNNQYLRINKRLISNLSLEPLLKTDLTRPYFNLSSDEDLIMKFRSTPYTKEQSFAMIRGLTKHASWPERIALWHTLKDRGIRNYSIDIDINEPRATALSSNEAFVNTEYLRIEAMSTNIMSVAKNQLSQGGMIIALTGMNHTPGLLAALKLLMKQEQQTDMLFVIQAIRLSSPYATDGIRQHLNCLPSLRDVLPNNIKEFYNLDNCPIEICNENPDGSFDTPILSSLSDNFYTTYYLNNFNDEKAQQIESLSGRIIEVLPDQNAVVHLHSAYLLAPIRKVLEIERYRINLTSDVDERLDYLKMHCPQMTIEIEDNRKFLVTFPASAEIKEHLNLVSKDDKWEEYCNETRISFSC